THSHTHTHTQIWTHTHIHTHYTHTRLRHTHTRAHTHTHTHTHTRAHTHTHHMTHITPYHWSFFLASSAQTQRSNHSLVKSESFAEGETCCLAVIALTATCSN